MSEVRVNNLSNENNTGGPTISGITTYSGRHFFVPPQGDTASRPEDCEPGSFRFNTDSAKLEYFRGNTIGWTEIEAELTEPLGGGTGSNIGLGHRGFAFGGHEGPNGSDTYTAEIDFFTISTLGDATKFGDLNNARGNGIAGFASRTRGIGAGGYAPDQNIIEFITMSSTGNTVDWGANPLNSLSYGSGAVSNQTRGVTMGGYNSSNTKLTDIQYLTIASLGTINDFGDISEAKGYLASVNSPTRGLCSGGVQPGQVNTIEFITIATTGSSQDFGDLTVNGYRQGGCMSSTRGLFAYGETPAGDNKKNIDYVTIASGGNGANFGDLSVSGQHPVGTSDSVRGVWLGRQNGSPYNNNEVIDYNTIATLGDAVDFGNLVDNTSMPASASTGHGGL